MSKWIPVSERLPDEGEQILLSQKIDIDIGIFSSKNREVLCAFGIYNIEIFNAWMPAPKPYKG